MKLYHDFNIKKREFTASAVVFLLESKLKLFLGKILSKWREPYRVAIVFPYGPIDLENKEGQKLKVNGLTGKHFLGGIDKVKLK